MIDFNQQNKTQIAKREDFMQRIDSIGLPGFIMSDPYVLTRTNLNKLMNLLIRANKSADVLSGISTMLNHLLNVIQIELSGKETLFDIDLMLATLCYNCPYGRHRDRIIGPIGYMSDALNLPRLETVESDLDLKRRALEILDALSARLK